MQYVFPKDFIWGAATAAYQIEGAYRRTARERIYGPLQPHSGKDLRRPYRDVACDHYHRYEEDIRIMKEIGLKSYSFPYRGQGYSTTGRDSEPKGTGFYRRLTEKLNESGIKPAATLYHWDLPQKLQDLGGWANRDTAGWFADYAAYMFEKLGDQVPIWITHNEPWVAAFVGHWIGRHSPGITDFRTALQAAHHLLLSHGQAVRAYRDMGCSGEIGITLNMNPVYPASEKEDDKAAAGMYDEYLNRWFADPVLKGSYPAGLMAYFQEMGLLPEMDDGDMELIHQPVDFLGVNNYYSSFIKYEGSLWPIPAAETMTGRDRTQMGWEIYPEGIHDLLMRLHRDYEGVKILITENGAAFNDIVNREGNVEDDNRLDYLYRYLGQVHRAISSGADVRGYYAWSLLDNFEWGHGYSKRFGLVYVDFRTQQRIMKKSAHWYRDVIRNNGF